MILNKARDNGASVLELTKATRLIKEGDRVKGIRASSQELGDLELSASVIIDASGRDCFCCTQGKLMVRDPSSRRLRCGPTRERNAIRVLTKGRPQWHIRRARAGFGTFH